MFGRRTSEPTPLASVMLRMAMSIYGCTAADLMALDPGHTYFRTLAQEGCPEQMARALGAMRVRQGRLVQLLRADGIAQQPLEELGNRARMVAAAGFASATLVRVDALPEPVLVRLWHSTSARTPAELHQRWRAAEPSLRPLYDQLLAVAQVQEEVERKERALAALSRTVERYEQRYLQLELAHLQQRTSLEGLEQAVAELRTTEEQRQLQAQRLSHELSRALTALLTTTELLEVGAPSPTQQTELLATLRAGAAQLRSGLDDLLLLDRLGTGAAPLSLAEVALGPMLQEAIDQQTPLARSHGLQLHCRIEPTDVRLRTDGRLLKVIVDNLIRNALNYTPRGGEVSLRVRGNGSGVLLEVADTGLGIDAQTREHMFEKYFSGAQEPPHEQTPRNGLGLYLVDRYVHALGGTITVASTPGKGSLFSVTVPAL